MKRILLACAVLAAALAAEAREPKKKPPEPAAPAEAYESSDARMGEALSAVCLPSPARCETYDGRDNLLIAEAADGSHAFLHLSGDCNFNLLMFAQSFTPKTPDGCLKAGDAITVADSFGAAHECRITQINQWKPEATYLPDPDYDQE